MRVTSRPENPGARPRRPGPRSYSESGRRKSLSAALKILCRCHFLCGILSGAYLPDLLRDVDRVFDGIVGGVGALVGVHRSTWCAQWLRLSNLVAHRPSRL